MTMYVCTDKNTFEVLLLRISDQKTPSFPYFIFFCILFSLLIFAAKAKSAPFIGSKSGFFPFPFLRSGRNFLVNIFWLLSLRNSGELLFFTIGSILANL